MVAAHTSAMIGLKLVSVPQRHETLAYVAVGSSTDLTTPKFDFRSSPTNGLKSVIA